jgi:hypothetical protein
MTTLSRSEGALCRGMGGRMRGVGPVGRVSMGIVACGLGLVLSASAAAALPTVPSDQAGSPLTEEARQPEDLDAATTISVPASAVFEFSFGQASSTPPPPPPEVTESWSHPLPTGRLLSQYGNRGIIPGVTTSAFHNGIDLAAPVGTQILAAGSGTVTYAGNGNRVLGLSGWVIVIEHLDGTSTAYNHMYESGVLVDVGDPVSAGDVIGLVGSAGRSTGPHLHFSAWVDGRAVNPVNYLLERGVEVPGGRETKDEDVFGDRYEWNWGPMPVDHSDDPIEEPIGRPEPNPVEQQPTKPEKDELEESPSPTPSPTPSPSPTPTDPATEEPTPTDPATEEPTPTDPATEEPTDPATDPTSDSSEPSSQDAAPSESATP